MLQLSRFHKLEMEKSSLNYTDNEGDEPQQLHEHQN